MTLLFKRKITCSVCGNESVSEAISSTNSFGSPDLDLRPPEMARSNINIEIHRCEKCGFCAYDLSQKIKDSEEIINTQKYLITLNNKLLPETANYYLCGSMLQKNARNLPAAAWNAISAAWVCDDRGNKEGAIICRMKAIGIIDEMELNGDSIAEDAGTSIALKVDLLRRSFNFADAIELIEKNISSIEDETISKVLLFEKQLIEKYDANCYTVAAAISLKKFSF